MRTRLAKTAGFCLGVKRALDRTLSASEESNGETWTLGPLIHNRQAVEMLAGRGVRAANSVDEIASGTVIIRAHGVPPDVEAALQEKGLKVIDATCPHVRKAQREMRRYSSEGYLVVVVGDRDHAEVIGLQGHCERQSVVIASLDEARNFSPDGPTCVMAQTTFNEGLFREIVETLSSKQPEIVVLDTICRATDDRQHEVRALADACEAVVIVGGYESANTRRLAEIAHSTGTPTLHVETAGELDVEDLRQYRLVGISAGASTPNWITRSVIDTVRRIESRQSAIRRISRRVGEALLTSNIYTCVGAIALTYACCLLQRMRTEEGFVHRYGLIAFCYIFAVYMLNRIVEDREDKLHAPTRVAFYRQHARLLLGCATVLALSSIALAFTLGPAAATLLVAAYMIGVAYNINVLPKHRLGLRRRRLKDIPASKDVFTASAWTAVAALVPFFHSYHVDGRPPGGTLSNTAVVCAVAFIAVFVRATMYDFVDIQGDRMLGRETLPVLLGKQRTKVILGILTAVLALALGGSAYTGLLPPLGYWLLLIPAYICGYLFVYHRQVLESESLGVLVVDGGLILIGVVAYAWRYVSQ